MNDSANGRIENPEFRFCKEEGGSHCYAYSCRWIHSTQYDLAFFLLPPLVSLVLVLLVWYSPLGRTAGYLVSLFLIFPHYISTFSFYFGDENLVYYRERWFVFFGVPLIIVGIVISFRAFGLSGFLGAIIIVWNIFHVSQQSAGILSIYRKINNPSSEALTKEKMWARRTFLFVNFSMAFWFMEKSDSVHDIVKSFHPMAPDMIRLFLMFGAAISLLCFLLAVYKRKTKLSIPEIAFFLSSLLLCHPFLWVEDIMLATLAMLTAHVIQYMAMIWLINRRKYGGGGGSTRQQWLGKLSASTPALVIFCFVVGMVFLFLDQGSKASGYSLSYWILANWLAMTHFYIDGLVWAFRSEHVRSSIGPFLFTFRVSNNE